MILIIIFSIRSGGLHWFAHGAESSYEFNDDTDDTGLLKCSPLACEFQNKY